MKKIRSFFFIFWIQFFLVCNTFGQFTISTTLPSSGILLKSQLWNLVVMNSADDDYCAINVSLFDASTNSIVMEASCPSVYLKKGVNYIANTISYNSINYQFANTNDINYNNSSEYLPIGNFRVCYSLLKVSHPVLLAEECLPIEVSLVSPPILNTPIDKDTVSTLRPTFTWFPPTPLNLLGDVKYHFYMTELKNDQSYLDAINSNVPVIQIYDLSLPVYEFVPSIVELDPHKKYVWRITAINNGKFLANSEVSSFCVKRILEKNEIISESYHKMKKDIQAGYVTFKKQIRIELFHELDDKYLQYSVTDLSGTSTGTLLSGKIDVTPGQNLIIISENIRLLTPNTIYLLKVFNSKGEAQYLKFKLL